MGLLPLLAALLAAARAADLPAVFLQRGVLLPYLNASGEINARCGESIAAWDGRVLVGCPEEDRSSIDAGSALLFETIGDAWVRTAKLKPAGPDEFGIEMGVSVGLGPDHAVCGAPTADNEGVDTNAGVVFVFQDSVNGFATPVGEATPPPAEVAFSDGFGVSATIAVADGIEYLYAGGPDMDVGENNRGAVYRFDLTSSGPPWTRVEVPLPPEAGTNDGIGASVSAVDRFLLVCAEEFDMFPLYTGGCFVYRDLDLRQILFNEGSGLNDAFAARGALAYDSQAQTVTAMVSAFLENGAGAVYIFESQDDGLSYSLLQRITRPEGWTGTLFGEAVAASVTHLAISLGKQVLVYRRVEGLWTQFSEAFPAVAGVGDFGFSLLFTTASESPVALLVGAPAGVGTGDYKDGAVVYYELQDPISTRQVELASSFGAGDADGRRSRQIVDPRAAPLRGGQSPAVLLDQVDPPAGMAGPYVATNTEIVLPRADETVVFVDPVTLETVRTVFVQDLAPSTVPVVHPGTGDILCVLYASDNIAMARISGDGDELLQEDFQGAVLDAPEGRLLVAAAEDGSELLGVPIGADLLVWMALEGGEIVSFLSAPGAGFGILVPDHHVVFADAGSGYLAVYAVGGTDLVSERTLAAPIVGMVAADRGGSLYFGTATQVVSLSSTLHQRWAVDLANVEVVAMLEDGASIVAVQGGLDGLMGLRMADGSEAWSVNAVPSTASAVAVRGDVLFTLLSGDLSVAAIDGRTGDVIWDVTTPSLVHLQVVRGSLIATQAADGAVTVFGAVSYVDGIEPARGVATYTTVVTVIGDNFGTVSECTVGGVSTAPTVAAPGIVLCDGIPTPDQDAAFYDALHDVEVVVEGLRVAVPGQLSGYPLDAPAITDLDAVAQLEGTLITLTARNLHPLEDGLSVTVDGVPCRTVEVLVPFEVITCTTPSLELGDHVIVVANRATGRSDSRQFFYSVVAPDVDSVVPASTVVGLSRVVTITGGPFQASLEVLAVTLKSLAGTINDTTVLSANETSLLALVVVEATAVPALYDVEVSVGSVTTLAPALFRVLPAPELGCAAVTSAEPGGSVTLPATNLPSPPRAEETAFCLFGDGTRRSTATLALDRVVCPVPPQGEWPVLPVLGVPIVLQLGSSFGTVNALAACSLAVSPRPLVAQAVPATLLAFGAVNVTVIGTFLLPSAVCRVASLGPEATRTVSVGENGAVMVCEVQGDGSGVSLLEVSNNGIDWSNAVAVSFLSTPAQMRITQQPPREDAGAFAGGENLVMALQVVDAVGASAFIDDNARVQATIEAADDDIYSQLLGQTVVPVNTDGSAEFSDVQILGQHGKAYRIRLEFVGVNANLVNTSRPVLVLECEDIEGSNFVGNDQEPNSCSCPPGASLQDDLCELCGLGTYKAEVGDGACRPCGPRQSTAEVGATSAGACRCSDGFLSDETGQGCLDCPEGGNCTVSDGLQALPGYWVASETGAESRVYACDDSARCLGGNRCAQGYRGPVCGDCDANHGPVGSFCVRCPPAGANAVLLLLIVAVGVLAIVALLRAATQPGKNASAATKVLLNYLQVLTAIGNFSLEWTAAVSSMLGLAGSLAPTSQNVSVDCAFQWTVFDRFLVAALTPLVIVAVIALVIGGIALWQRGFTAKHRSMAVLSTTFLLLLVHPSLLQTTVSVLRCRDFRPDGEYVAVDLGVRCEGAEYNQYATGAILFFVFYGLGLPVATAVLLRRNPDAPTLLFLTSGYRRSSYWYELAILARKVAIVMIGALLDVGPIQLFSALLVVYAGIAAHVQRRPFKSRDVSLLEMSALWTLVLTLSSSLVFFAERVSPDVVTAMTVVVILLNLGLVIAFAVYILSSHLKSYQSSALAKVLERFRRRGTDDDEGEGEEMEALENGR